MTNPFFTKREPQNFSTRPSGLNSTTNTLQTAAVVDHHAATAAAVPATQPPASAVDNQSGSKLTVGPNIKLKGVEITDCDTLVVEGTVEATMDSRVIHIAQQGAFHGAAEIDIAEIHGHFQGSLTVREKLVIHSTGKVSGKIRYGKIVIEEGGQLFGEIEVGTTSHAPRSAAAKSVTPAAPAVAAVA